MASEDLIRRARQMSNDIATTDYISDGIADDAHHLIKVCGLMIEELTTTLEGTMPSPVVDVKPLDFFDALRAVLAGKKIRRPNWPDTDCLLMHHGALHLRDAKGLHTLIVSDADMQATDWDVVTED